MTTFRDSASWVTTGGTTYKGPSGGVDYTALADNGKLAKNPVYMIEDMGVELPPGVSGGSA